MTASSSTGSSAEWRGDLGDQTGPGEDLVPSHQLTARIEHLSGEGVDLSAGQPRRELRCGGAGLLEGSGEAIDAPTDLGELVLPPGDERVGSGVALHGPGVTGGDAAGSVAAVAGLGEIGVDLVSSLRVQVAHGLGDPHDPPVPEVFPRALGSGSIVNPSATALAAE